MPDDEENGELQPGLRGEPQAVTIKFTIERAESYIYSNVASVSLSPMDIRIDFADVRVDGKSKTVAGITLSPENAAGLVLILTNQLRQFEKEYGDIRNPKWRAMKQAVTEPQGSPPNSPLTPTE